MRRVALLLYVGLVATFIFVSSPYAGGLDTARQILGADLIVPAEITNVLPLRYSDDLLGAANASLPPPNVLNELASQNYILLFGPPTPMSILEIRALFPAEFYQNPDLETVWYERLEAEMFARDELVGPGWLAIMKQPYPGSTGKSWKEQKTMLSGRERVPNAAELSWLVITYRASRGIQLFRGKPFVRTSSTDSRGSRIFAFQRRTGTSYGLAFSGHFDRDASPAIGLAAKYLLPKPQ